MTILSGRTERWIATLVAGLDEHVDKETRATILEKCGRQCQSKAFVDKARSICRKSRDIDEFL